MKHTIPAPVDARGLARFGWAVIRGGLAGPTRVYRVPTRKRLPEDFIRLDPWEMEYLFTVASLSRVGIVEIGRLRGGSTFLLACANRDLPIWSVDLAPTADQDLREVLAQFEVGENVHLLVGDSRSAPLSEIGRFDLLFVDGGHSYATAMSDMERFFPRLEPGGSMLLHDCYGGHSVQRATRDFVASNDLDVIRSPYIPAAHWRTEYGSIAHLRKPR